jgi:peptidyl-prolyl cis-trans isomerase C
MVGTEQITVKVNEKNADGRHKTRTMRGSCRNVVGHERFGSRNICTYIYCACIRRRYAAYIYHFAKRRNDGPILPVNSGSRLRSLTISAWHYKSVPVVIVHITSLRISHFETMVQLSSPRMRPFNLFYLPILIAFCTAIQTASASDAETQQQFKNDRQAAKPWYTQSMSSKFPLSPVTVSVLLISIVYLLSSWAGPVYNCQASHILIQEHDEETKEKLEKLKKTIQGDVNKFRKTAKEVSSCPSKNQGGYLGQFKRGAMAPGFDKVCFDPATPLETTVGPIQTQFGWHLIFIHERKMP